MRWNFFKSPICFIAAPIIICVCVLELSHTVAFQRFEWITYDWRMRLAHDQATAATHNSTNLGFAEISDNTITAVNNGTYGYKFGLYWPRQVYARALDELSHQGAKAVAFDIIFDEPRPDHPPVELPDGTTISSDEYFARALKKAGNAILAADQNLLPAPLFKTSAWRVGQITADPDSDGILRRIQAFSYFHDWHPFVKQMAAEFGLDLTKTKEAPGSITFHRQTGDPITFKTDEHGTIAMTDIVNPVPTNLPARFSPYSLARVWNMGIILAAAELHLDLDHPELDLSHHRIVLRGENGVSRVIPVTTNGLFFVDWSMGREDPNLTKGSFDELLAGEQERAAGHPPIPNRWRNKLVIIGSTATGNDLTDRGSTPLESATYLVSTYWNVANSVMADRFILTTPTAVNIILIVIVGSLSAWITWVVTKPVTGSVLMIAIAVFYLAVAVALFNHWRIWIPIVLPLICAGLVTHIGAITYRVTVEQSEKKRIKSLFSRLVSPEVVNQVIGTDDTSLGALAGRRRHITVSFADIRGFTELTDAAQSEGTEFVTQHALSAQLAEDYFDKQAKEVMDTVSLYLSTIADCVKGHHGTLDKYIGDCVMAFWGAPVDNPKHALAAVRCAIEAQKALHAINAEREQENRRREAENFERLRTGEPMLSSLPVLSMGTGINTGMAIAGFMGSDAHIVNYTVFGREVNLASRLEGISGHGRIIIGEGTYLELKRDDPELARSCIELPPKVVKGFRDRVRIFEVQWKPAAAAPIPPADPAAPTA